MLAAERQAAILAELRRHGSVRVSDLVERLGVSDMTIRRDLTALEEQGVLSKVHGGATASEIASTTEPGFAAKSSRGLAQKAAIAAAAARMVRPGSAIAISAGTTTHALARHLVDVPGLTVVTNSVWVADVLYRSGHPNSSVLLTGGLRTPSDALVGPLSIAALASLHLDLVFLGVHGMDPQAGFTTPNLMESETNRAMVASAGKLVVVTDSSKWRVVGLSTMAPLSAADVLITDTGLAPEGVEVLTEQTGQLRLVEPVLDVLAGGSAT